MTDTDDHAFFMTDTEDLACYMTYTIDLTCYITDIDDLAVYIFWIRQYPYKSQLFCVIDILGNNFQ